MATQLNRSEPDTTAIAGFNTNARVQITEFLTPDSAENLRAALLAQRQWNLVFQIDGQHVDSDATAFAASSASDQNNIETEIHRAAAKIFQYYFQTIPIYDLAHRNELPAGALSEVMRCLRSETFLSFMRELCDAPEISFADAQATLYAPGHFLTRHDDDVAGKSRVAAYVLNLSDNWSPDWGGALQFFDKSGDVKAAWQPRLNTLNVFKVPQDHSVSFVAPFAQEPRLAITGWLRSGTDPGPD